jgi:hypothetical protein
MELPEFGILQEEDSLDTRDRVIEAYVKIAQNARKPSDQLRAIDKIAELRGFKIDRMVSDVTKLSPEDLERLIEELIIPSLMPYGVKGRKIKVVDDVPLDD